MQPCSSYNDGKNLTDQPDWEAGKTTEQPQKTSSVSGAGDRSRTYDLLITNELLYQLSYTGTGREW